MQHKKQILHFQQEILDWYAKNKRDLPWRQTRDPYKILVSEIMLQQTQVNRVIPKYETWLERFPTIESLSEASKEDILRLWSGLGYNRRALYLQKCAQVIVERKGWPKQIEELEKLPGIGSYTARAIACFAFDQQVAVVDANVRKIILLKYPRHCEESRFNRDDEAISKKRLHHKANFFEVSPHSLHSLATGSDPSILGTMTNKELQKIADQLLPIGRAYDWNQALMDYSNLVLQKEKVIIKKQPSFKNSNRYYRGKLLRLLLMRNNIPLQQVGSLLKDDYTVQDKPWLETLIDKLSIDGLIIRDKEEIRL